jgi:hypothetical protein
VTAHEPVADGEGCTVLTATERRLTVTWLWELV